ncbi:unnamed protein product [Penicillium nalgiovense]|nr:unnamed protein product [Penicillium nalgiovense]
MATQLPLELLIQIANILRVDEAPLAPCASVCYSCRMTFEPLIYSKLVVYSDEDHKEEGQSGISLATFQELTSGHGAPRRSWIRELEYNIITPSELLDWKTRKQWPHLKKNDEEDYSTQNPIRKANDVSFQTAMASLFQTLSSWDQRGSLTLRLGLKGYRWGKTAVPEPNTWYEECARYYVPGHTDEYNMLVPPYRARFYGVTNLPHVCALVKLAFLNDSGRHHQIWAGAVQAIIEHCPNITALMLDFKDWIRPDFVEYMEERREGIDSLAINLRDLSTCLREFRVESTTIPLDFMWPLKEDGQPIIDGGSWWWPYLETWEVYYVTPWLPSGQWIFLPDGEEQETIDYIYAIGGWDDEIYEKKSDAERALVDIDQLHRLFISLGYAAQRMPRLKRMEFVLTSKFEWYYAFSLFFFNNPDTITLTWHCDFSYRPDSRFARAWDFCLDDVVIDSPREGTCSVALQAWPPSVSI